MKNFKHLIALLLISSVFFACDEDDSTTPSSNSNGGANADGTNASLVGTWNGFEFYGDDGNLYALNTRVPYYDSSYIEGCAVYDYSEIMEIFSLEFKSDSTVINIYHSKDYDRSFAVLDSVNCQFTYGNWDEDLFRDTSESKYKVLSTTKIEFTYLDDSGNIDGVDTSNYTLVNGVLEADKFARMRK